MGKGSGKAKSTMMRRWHFHAYFLGDAYESFPLDFTEEDVRKVLDEKYYGGNWKSDSLRRGSKYKVFNGR